MLKFRTRTIRMSVVLLVLIVAVISISRLNTFASGNTSGHTRVFAQNSKTIAGLRHISIVGSTQFIVDAKGHTASADANPYGVAVVPRTHATMTAGNVQAGDIVVTNIGGTDTGTTLVTFRGKVGPGHLFNTAANTGTSGPADEAFNAATGTDWVANVSANKVQIFNPNGTLFKDLTSPLFNHPWGVTSNQNKPNPGDKSVGSFFVTNTKDATIDRVDIVPTANGLTFPVFQIGQLTPNGKETKIGVLWLPSLNVAGKHFSDVLLAIDPAGNRIAAYPNSTTTNTTMSKSTNKGMPVFQGKPLNQPGGFAINPLNGDLLVVNLNDNNLVELNLSQSKVVAVTLLDNAPVDPQSGNGSALFGVAATTDAKGKLQVFFTDDNTNTLDLLSL